ncbi:hypothetical protein R6Z07F_001630 [Ovis aries]
MGSPQTLKSSAHAKPLTHLKPEAEAGRGGQGTRDASGLQPTAASPTPPREPRPHLCPPPPPPPPPPLARSPWLCRRRSEPHTHRYTQPSDVTEPSARPRHCGDTRLPADAAAVSGRPGESEGGEGEGRRGELSQRRHRARKPAAAAAAAASRLLAPRGRARRLPYSGSLGLPWPVVWRARPSPQARARHSWPRAPSGRLARGAVCGAPGADRMFPPRPTPTAALPPSFLESPSRLSGAATAPPPPHPLLRGDGPDPGAPWSLGRRATRREGGRATARCTVRDPSSRQGGGKARLAERRGPRSGTGDPPPAGPQLGRPAPEAAGWRPPSRAPRVGPARGGCPPPPAGPPARGPPRQLPALRCAPPHPGGPRLAWAASAQTPSLG